MLNYLVSEMSRCAVIRGGATGGVWGTTYPPLLRYVPRRGYNAIYVVRAPAGYYRLQLAAKVTQFTFGFSTWKFCFLYSLLQQ